MKKEDFKNGLDNANERYSNCQKFEFVDKDGNKLGTAGINDVCRVNKTTSAFVCSEEDAYKDKEEYNAGDIRDFLCNAAVNLVCWFVDRNGKEKSYNKMKILGHVNPGTGENDKIQIEVSND